MSDSRYTFTPSSVDIKRSTFNLSHRHITTMFHGDLVPLMIKRVYPGDTFNLKLKTLIRMSTPIAPIMDNIDMNFTAFFVPLRLVWDKTKAFYGENPTGSGIYTNPTEPMINNACALDSTIYASKKRSLANYLNLFSDTPSGGQTPEWINLNYIRSYYAVYNFWFRNSAFMSPVIWNKDQTGHVASASIGTVDGNYLWPNSQGSIMTVCKKLDRFTTCLPYTQKLAGSGVLIGLAGFAPVIGTGKGIGVEMRDGIASTAETLVTKDFGLVRFGAESIYGDTIEASASYLGKDAGWYDENTTGQLGAMGAIGLSQDATKSGVIADLSSATGLPINEVRLAFQTQKYYEALCNVGTMRDYIKVMFGVDDGDLRAQMPEYLGGFTVNINVDQVLSTTGYQAGSGTTLGVPGANSVSAGIGHIINKSFSEPGYIVVVAYAKHNQTYSGAIDPDLLRNDILDYYNPKFANIGNTPLLKKEVRFSNNADDDSVFGFNEAWADLRSCMDVVTGDVAPNRPNSLSFWTLANNLSSDFSLNKAFILENRDSISRALTTGSSGFDYLVDVYFDMKATRPLPVYSVPGLVDHH